MDMVTTVQQPIFFFLKGRGKRIAAPIYIRRERYIQTPRELREMRRKTTKKNRKEQKQPNQKKKNHWAKKAH
jgi:TfoX/Sxy family transcriptional regulator of competence genes